MQCARAGSNTEFLYIGSRFPQCGGSFPEKRCLEKRWCELKEWMLLKSGRGWWEGKKGRDGEASVFLWARGGGVVGGTKKRIVLLKGMERRGGRKKVSDVVGKTRWWRDVVEGKKERRCCRRENKWNVVEGMGVERGEKGGMFPNQKEGDVGEGERKGEEGCC